MTVRVVLRGVLVGLLLAGAGLTADPAGAVTCTQHATATKTADVSVKVPLSSACDVSYNTVDSAARVNEEKMFTFSDWQFLSRDNTDPTLGTPDEVAVPISMQIIGDALKGSVYLASNIWSRYTNLFVVLKAGGRNSNISGFVSYLLKPGTTTWSYMTPFLNAKGTEQQISHFTIYGRVAPIVPPPPPPPPPPRPSPVPLPFGGLLLVSALAGLAVIRGRRAAA